MTREKNERYMPLYLDTFLDATYHLTPKHQMLYMKMIWWQFHNKKGFDNAKHACRMIGVSSREIVIIQSILDEFYDRVLNETVSTLYQNGTELLPNCDSIDTVSTQNCYSFVQKRTIEEIERIASKSNTAKKNVAKRWKKSDTNVLLEEKRREEKRREDIKNSQKKENDVSVSDDFLVSETLKKKESEKPQTVKAFASEAQAYAEAQAKACESETAVLYRFSWVLAWLSTYQTPEEAVKRGVGEPELLDLFKQAVDASISAQKAHNPRYVQAVFRNSVEAWTPQARGKPNAFNSPNVNLRNISKQWEREPKGVSDGF
jgi:hypothetical protein